MSGETKSNVSAWTIDSLKEYLESRIDGNDLRYDQRFTAQEAATAYAQEKANEFRGSLDDIGKKQMPRTEAEAAFRSLSEKAETLARTNAEKIDALQARLDRNEGRSGGINQGWIYLVAAVGLLGTIIMSVIALRR